MARIASFVGGSNAPIHYCGDANFVERDANRKTFSIARRLEDNRLFKSKTAISNGGQFITAFTWLIGAVNCVLFSNSANAISRS